MALKKGSQEARDFMAKIRNAKRQTGTSNKTIDKQRQALPVGKRTSPAGNVYYERREDHSDKGKLLGVNDMNTEIINDYNMTCKRIEIFTKNINSHTQQIYDLREDKKAALLRKNLLINVKLMKKYLDELKQHKTELKKLM